MLNLPEIDIPTRTEGGKQQVFDTLRKRFVSLTPEENVRQHFVNFLIHHKSYPAALMANEVSLTLGEMSRRCDTVVYDSHLRPLMIVEYKRPDVPITQKVFQQIYRYNLVMHVDWLIVSNGITHYCCHMDYANNTYTFTDDIPTYSSLLTPNS